MKVFQSLRDALEWAETHTNYGVQFTAPHQGQAAAWCVWQTQSERDTHAPPAQPITRYVALDEFRQRLSNGKFAAVAALADTDAAAFAFLLDIASRTTVDLEDPRLSAGLDYFVSKGALSPEDKTMLLE